MTAVRPVAPVLTGRGTLLRALAHALGGERQADEFLRDALWDAGMDTVPDSREGFESFVRDEVLPRLVPLVRLEQLHDLVRRTIGEEGSLHPPPLKPHGSVPQPGGGVVTTRIRRPRVVLVEPDAFRRIAVSRDLVRGGFDVEAVASAAEVLEVPAFHVVLMPLDEAGERVARELVARGTRAGLVSYDDAEHRGAIRRTIDTWPNDRVALVGRHAPVATISARVRIVVS